MTSNARCARSALGLLLVLALCAQALAQDANKGAVRIPSGATALEGLPTVRVETTSEGAARRQLDASESARNRISIRIEDGGFYALRHDERVAPHR
jgi:hypothetical protein